MRFLKVSFCRMILNNPLVLVTKLKIPAGNSKSHLAWKKKFPEMKSWHAQMGQNMQLEASNGFAKCFSIIILPNNSTTHLYGDYAHDFTRQEMVKPLWTFQLKASFWFRTFSRRQKNKKGKFLSIMVGSSTIQDLGKHSWSLVSNSSILLGPTVFSLHYVFLECVFLFPIRTTTTKAGVYTWHFKVSRVVYMNQLIWFICSVIVGPILQMRELRLRKKDQVTCTGSHS